ncbi:MAG: hypothetical protein JSS91_09030 [Bacteroidetes bacterium]|nr:hypothetical protein [Bacteroidota bacterium]
MKDFNQKFSVNGRTIELLNRMSDPGMWVVNVYSKFLFFKRKETSHWFCDKTEAETFVKSFSPGISFK